jgi:5-methylcytosine-specific restriction endonuclease McrA
MLVADIMAYIEQLDVVEGDKSAQKVRRRIAEAELEVLRVSAEARMAMEALRVVEAATEPAHLVRQHAGARSLLPRRSREDLDRDLAVFRARLAKKQAEVLEKQRRLRELEAKSLGRSTRQRRTRLYRLHSDRHHIDWSEERFARLADTQLREPVWVTSHGGRRWWWFLDRFWWDAEGLSSAEVKRIVLDTDLDRKEYYDALEQARAAAFGQVRPADEQESILESVRFAVWRRDNGRCVDCAAYSGLEFDFIIPPSEGGSDTEANVELRCRSCRVRRMHNEAQAGVSRARLSADGRPSEEIPAAVRQRVWERDAGRCVDCGSSHDLDFDHILAVSKGGSDIAENVELRCVSCRSRRVLS